MLAKRLNEYISMLVQHCRNGALCTYTLRQHRLPNVWPTKCVDTVPNSYYDAHSLVLNLPSHTNPYSARLLEFQSTVIDDFDLRNICPTINV